MFLFTCHNLRIALSRLLPLAMFAVVAAPVAAQATDAPAKAPVAVNSKFGANVTELKKIEVKQGDGAEAIAGRAVIVDYTGWLYDPAAPDGHGAKFDSSVGKLPFGFVLGVGRVIKGWDQGVAGMKVGGRRRIVIPPDLGYGKQGAGGVIKGGETLVFVVDLLEVR